MKKIIIYSLILMFLLSSFGLNLSYNVVADSYLISIPEKIDIRDNETSFEIKLNTVLKNNQRVRINVTGDDYLTCGNDLKIKLDTKLTSNILSNSNPSVTITIGHEDLPFGNWKSNLRIAYALEETLLKTEPLKSQQVPVESSLPQEEKHEPVISKEEKTMYSFSSVTAWDEENYLLEKPSCDYEERIQYATIQASFSESSFSLEIPEDGFFESALQYGYNQRSKTQVKVPHTSYRRVGYNNTGKCPSDCIKGTKNDYGTGCECEIEEAYTTYETSYSYGQWTVNDSSWRFNSPYSSSDVVSPVERTVYLTPVNWSEPSDWSYNNPGNSQTTKSVSRTVYVVPASYSAESEYQDSKPSGDHLKIKEQKFCRIITDGVAGSWKKCD